MNKGFQGIMDAFEYTKLVCPSHDGKRMGFDDLVYFHDITKIAQKAAVMILQRRELWIQQIQRLRLTFSSSGPFALLL